MCRWYRTVPPLVCVPVYSILTWLSYGSDFSISDTRVFPSECPRGQFKSDVENSACQPCPDKSVSSSKRKACNCIGDYYRSPGDSSKPCQGMYVCTSTGTCTYFSYKQGEKSWHTSAVALAFEEMHTLYASGQQIRVQKFRDAYQRREIGKQMLYFCMFCLRLVETESRFLHMLYASLPWFCVYTFMLMWLLTYFGLFSYSIMFFFPRNWDTCITTWWDYCVCCLMSACNY